MIGKLKGVVDEVEDDHVVLDVGGVGYSVFCPVRTVLVSREGEPLVLHVETVVREDLIRLYGFASKAERELFRLLQANVQGVGAKVAMAVVSTLAPAELAAAISSGDVTAVSRTPGVGRKVAERIIDSMKGKLPAGLTAGSEPAAAAPKGRAAEEAISALVNLGYPKEKAAAAISAAIQSAGPDADVSSLLALGLKAAAR